MRITPAEIRRKQFSRGMRGYSDAEVDAFLDEIANDLERTAAEQAEHQQGEVQGIAQEHAALLEEVQTLRAKLAEYERIADALPKALIAAEATAEEVKQNATKAAQIVLREAEAKARQIVSASYNERHAVEQSTLRLRTAESEFRQRFRGMLEGYLKLANEGDVAALRAGEAATAASGFSPQAEALREALVREEKVDAEEAAQAAPAPAAVAPGSPAPAAATAPPPAPPAPAQAAASSPPVPTVALTPTVTPAPPAADDVKRSVPPAPMGEGDGPPDTTVILDRHVDAIREALAREEAAAAPAVAAPAPAEAPEATPQPAQAPEAATGGADAGPEVAEWRDDAEAHVTGEVKAHEFKW